MDELEFYDGAFTGQEIDDGVNAALNPETEAVDIYDSEAVEGNSTLVSVEAMAATMLAASQGIRVYSGLLSNGTTLTVSGNGNSNRWSVAIFACYPGASNNSFVLVQGGSNTATSRTISKIVDGGNLTVTGTTGGFTVVPSTNVYITALVLFDLNNAVTVTGLT